MNRWGRGVAWLLLACVVAAAGWWAGRATLQRPVVDEVSDAGVSYTVIAGDVGQSQTFTATAAWPTRPAAVNPASGTVTTVSVSPDKPVAVGAVLYSVDLRPVVAAVGSVPSFRDLSAGATGTDVSQLQDFLRSVGVRKEASTGRMDAATVAEVRTWQKSVGVAADGTVRSGDLVYLPQLPARVLLGEAITVGAQVGPGVEAVSAVGDAPSFGLVLDRTQSDLVPLDAQVVVTYADGTWPGVMGTATSTDEGNLRIELVAPDGGVLCGDSCAVVPVGVESSYRVQVIVVPETSGPVVPAAALGSETDGTSYVVMSDGSHRTVEILASANGRSVVKGVDVGEVIRLFGGDASSPPAPGPAGSGSGGSPGATPT